MKRPRDLYRRVRRAMAATYEGTADVKPGRQRRLAIKAARRKVASGARA